MLFRSIFPRLLVDEARWRLWRTRKLPLVGLGALEDDELPSRDRHIQEYVVTRSCLISHHPHGTGNMVDRLSLQLTHGRYACAGLATPRERLSRELGIRFGGLMAHSYTRRRLSTSEEVLGRGLGKGDWWKNTQPSMCTIVHPLEQRA